MSKSICDWFSSDDEEFEFKIPSGLNITAIPDYAFYNNTNLTKVTLGEGILSIGTYAFKDCDNLKSITIPENVLSIGKGAFNSCNYVSELYFNAINLNDLASANYAFSALGVSGDGVSISTGANVTRIPAYLFYFTSANFVKTLSVTFADESSCAEIGTHGLFGFKNLESIEIPASVTSIGTATFPACLTQLILNCSEGDIDSTPWGATNAEIVYNG
ncbi:MAG: leucine-rich repeat domain-containing protein [Clostridiales bacterium]|nr:leucine-rich repeat domain-containing protein [Clostridiales bacterium]